LQAAVAVEIIKAVAAKVAWVAVEQVVSLL
jgi:hypothetical protein